MGVSFNGGSSKIDHRKKCFNKSLKSQEKNSFTWQEVEIEIYENYRTKRELTDWARRKIKQGNRNRERAKFKFSIQMEK